MRLSRVSAWVMAALVLTCLSGLSGLAGGAGGQGVSEQGNPWVRVSLGKVTVQAEAVRTPERLYQGLSYRRELPEGRGMLFLHGGKGGAELLHAGDAHPPGPHLDQRRPGGGCHPERAPDLPGGTGLPDGGGAGPGSARRVCRPARDQDGGPGEVALRGLIDGIAAGAGQCSPATGGNAGMRIDGHKQ